MKFQNCKIVAEGVSAKSYHNQDARRGTPEFAMSPSELKRFADCPAKWLEGGQSESTDSTEWGDQIDMMVLTPDKFTEKYFVTPETYPAPATHEKVKSGAIKAGGPLPWNANATYCKQHVASQGNREPISTKDYVLLSKAYTRLKQDPLISRFLQQSRSQVLVVGEAVLQGITIPLRCLIDAVPDGLGEFSDSLGDLKTTCNARHRNFRRWAYDAGYHVQGAFDLDLFNAATGEQRATWCLLLQENYYPFLTGRRFFSQKFISVGRFDYTMALQRYATCLQTGIWPDYEEGSQFGGWSIIDPEPYMIPAEVEVKQQTQMAAEKSAADEMDIAP